MNGVRVRGVPLCKTLRGGGGGEGGHCGFAVWGFRFRFMESDSINGL